MELRNICNHPFLSRLHAPGAEHALSAHALPPALRLCGKLAVLDRLLLKLSASGHKVRLSSALKSDMPVVAACSSCNVRLCGNMPHRYCPANTVTLHLM